jgi:ferredoxin
MRVRVDQERCQGHGRCYSLAPDVFESDDVGNGVERNGGEVAAEHEAQARLGALNCPEGAVVLDEG